MSAAECWYDAKKFKGLDEDGETCDYKRGDLVPGVESWPTFNFMRSIGYIVAPPLRDVSAKKPSQVAKTSENIDDGFELLP